MAQVEQRWLKGYLSAKLIPWEMQRQNIQSLAFTLAIKIKCVSMNLFLYSKATNSTLNTFTLK